MFFTINKNFFVYVFLYVQEVLIYIVTYHIKWAMTSWTDSKLLYNPFTPLLYEKPRCLNAAETYCMSKNSCPIFIVYSLYTDGQELLDILYDKELSIYGIESLQYSLVYSIFLLLYLIDYIDRVIFSILFFVV